MSHTNVTKNLKLSQFIGTDQPDWLTDYNSDMEKIDQAYGNFTGSETNLRADINKNTADITTLKGNVNALQLEQNEQATDITTVKESITALQTENTTQQADIDELKGQIGRAVGNGSWIVIGDDWGIGANSYFQPLKAMIPNKKIYTNAKAGAGLTVTANSFYQLLIEITGSVTDRSYVEAIIILGGKNDLDNYQNKDLFINALETISVYAGANYPNAMVYIGLLLGERNNIYSYFTPIKEIQNYSISKTNITGLPTFGEFLSTAEYITEGTSNLTLAGAKYAAQIILDKMFNRYRPRFVTNSITLTSENNDYINNLFIGEVVTNNLISIRSTGSMEIIKQIPKGNMWLIPFKPLLPYEGTMYVTVTNTETNISYEMGFGWNQKDGKSFLVITALLENIPVGTYAVGRSHTPFATEYPV